VEQVRRIVGAGAGFGVILDGVDGKAAMPEAFDRVVVQVDVRNFTIGGQRVGIDREAVVLRGDLDTSGRQILHRLVSTVMPKRQFVGSATERETHQLMPKAYPKNRITSDQLFEVRYDSGERLGITRPVR